MSLLLCKQSLCRNHEPNTQALKITVPKQVLRICQKNRLQVLLTGGLDVHREKSLLRTGSWSWAALNYFCHWDMNPLGADELRVRNFRLESDVLIARLPFRNGEERDFVLMLEAIRELVLFGSEINNSPSDAESVIDGGYTAQ